MCVSIAITFSVLLEDTKKYCLTRLRRFFALPTYSTFPSPSI